MKPCLLAIRISRRAIGAVSLSDEGFTFSDSRHLTSRKEQGVQSGQRYVSALVAQLVPERVALYAPSSRDGVTRTLTNVLVNTLQQEGIAVRVVERRPLLAAFGVEPLQDSDELHAAVLDIWPECEGRKGAAADVIAEAAAAALYAEAADTLGTPT